MMCCAITLTECFFIRKILHNFNKENCWIDTSLSLFCYCKLWRRKVREGMWNAGPTEAMDKSQGCRDMVQDVGELCWLSAENVGHITTVHWESRWYVWHLWAASDYFNSTAWQQLRQTTDPSCRAQDFPENWSVAATVHQGRVQQLTDLIDLSIGPAYVRLFSCWTAFIVIQ